MRTSSRAPLSNRGLIRIFAGGLSSYAIALTPDGIDQVESLDDPDYETPLLASRNAVQISGTGHNVVLQQGTEASHQQATISSEQRTQVARFAEDFESALEESPLDEPDQSSARAALSTVQGQLALPEAEPTLVQAAVSVMQRIALGATTGVATSAAWEGVKELARQL